MVEAALEVRKNEKSTTWYVATLRDVVDTYALVGFEGGVWPDREVPLSSVRLYPQERPELLDADGIFRPQQDHSVEVRVQASANNPAGWALGVVRAVKDSFYYIAFEGRPKDLIVEHDALRPVSHEQPLQSLRLRREVVDVESGLHSWLVAPDSVGCFGSVQASVGLLTIRAHHPSDSAEASEPATGILLIGEDRPVRRGKMLLQIHILHQQEIQAFHERRRHKLQKLQDQTNRFEGMQRDEFTCSPSLVGRTIGKGGEHLKRVQKELNVEVMVVEGSSPDDDRVIRLFGQSSASVAEARQQLELIKELYPVEKDQVGWFLGKGHSQMQDVIAKSGLASAEPGEFDDSKSALVLVGTQTQIEDARMLLDSHAEYYRIYQEMAVQQKEIQDAFEALGDLEDPGRRGGKSKGSKGKDKGKGKENGENTESQGSKGKDKGKGKENGENTESQGGYSRSRGGGRGDHRPEPKREAANGDRAPKARGRGVWRPRGET